MTTGIIGVPLGSYLSQRFNRKYPRADAYICALGLILSAPLLAGGMLTVTANTTLAYVLVFFGELALNLNWAIVADILLVRINVTAVCGLARKEGRKYSRLNLRERVCETYSFLRTSNNQHVQCTTSVSFGNHTDGNVANLYTVHYCFHYIYV